MSAEPPSQNGSLLKAIDGGHLPWNDFRRDVLQPFGIVMTEAPLREQLPPSILSYLQWKLETVPEAVDETHSWNDQVLAGTGFNANCTIFPPNLLPPISMPVRLQRCQSPKMARDGLPRRKPSVHDCLFELPHAKPIFVSAFTYEAFSENEHRAMPSFAVPAGTSIDFVTGKVASGRLLPCPFLAYEYCQGSKSYEVEASLNMCAISGTQCLKGIEHMLGTAGSQREPNDNTFAFSCAVNDTVAVINSHTTDAKGQYVMSPLCRFDLDRADHFQTFQIWIQAIEGWACEKLLMSLKTALLRASQPGVTPPSSPMPSLTLSIDTVRGSMPSLLRALRSTHSAIKWQSQDEAETPIMSSMAACGTPWEGRRLQSLALAATSPIGAGPSLVARRRHTSQGSLPPIQTKNPLTYTPTKPSPLSPRYITSPDLYWQSESPCRPCALSPSTPAPDMPWAAKSPMLVLQKRVEVAMDEIQELRRQMEALQHELNEKNQSLSAQINVIALPAIGTEEKGGAGQKLLCLSQESGDEYTKNGWRAKATIDRAGVTKLLGFFLIVIISLTWTEGSFKQLFRMKFPETAKCSVESI